MRRKQPTFHPSPRQLTETTLAQVWGGHGTLNHRAPLYFNEQPPADDPGVEKYVSEPVIG